MTLIRVGWLGMIAALSVAGAATLGSVVSTPAVAGGSAIFGAPLTIQSTVTPSGSGGATPSGTVTFKIDGTAGTPQLLDPLGGATVSPSLTAGQHTVSAHYDGDSNYVPSSSGSLALTVAKATTQLALSPSVAQLSQAIAIQAALTLNSPSAGTPGAGTVDFFIGGAAIGGCSAVPVQSGSAVCNTSVSQLGIFPVTAHYNGDANSQSSDGTLQLTVSKVVAGTYVSWAPDAPVYGTPVTLGAQLLGATGVAAPTGSITFVIGSGTLPPLPVGSDGHATMVFPSGAYGLLNAGSYPISAMYSGDEHYQASSATMHTLTVAKAATNLVLTSTTPQVGQVMTLKATVTVAGSNGIAAGTVAMSNGTAPICTGVAVLNGAATCSLTISQGGAYTINASYIGDSNTLLSTQTLQFTVGKAPGGIATTFTPAAPVFGAMVTLTAQLTAADGQAMPTGSVSFSDGTTALGSAAVGSDGRASLAVPLSVGTHSIVAVYGGDTNYQSITATAVSLSVAKASTSVGLTSGAAQPGLPVTLKAAVTVVSGSATPGGTADFSYGGKAIAGCTGLALQSGAAACTTTFLQAGDYSVAAAYSGDGNTLGASATMTLSVGKLVPGFSTSSAQTATVLGAPVSIVAVLTGATGQAVPTGTVAFADGTSALASVAVGSDGKASLVLPSGTLAALAVGTHAIGAVYGGDANYQGVTAAALNVAVSKAATTVALTSNSLQAGQPLNLKAVVSVVSPGSATPAGSVDFSNGSSPISGCTAIALQNGTAACTITLSQPGDYSMKAVYNGDGNTLASAATLPLSMGKAVASVYTAAVASTLVYGAVATVNALVQGATGAATPTGTVAFSDGATALASIAVGSDGRASLVVPAGTLAPLSVGTHAIGAVYSGDGTYQTATAAPLTVVVGKAATSVALWSNQAQAGLPVTLKAVVTAVAPGAGTPAGTVDFSSGGKAIAGCTGVAVQNATAACNATWSQVGDNVVGAAYSGDTNTAASSASLTVTVTKAVAGFYTATPSSAPPYGAAVTINALLTGAAGLSTPSGAVAFSDGSTALATVPVGSDGRASLMLPSSGSPPLSIGTHAIGAVYSGDANYQSVTAAVLNVVVSKAATAITLAATPAQVGQPFSVSAAVTLVSPGSATLGGSVSFTNGAVAIAGCTAMALQSGSASCSTSLSQLGDCNIGVTYSGDAYTAASTASLKVTVGKAVAGIYTASAPAGPVFGAPVTINALLLGAAGLAAPTGTVTFSDGAVLLATLPVGSDGRASLVAPSGTMAALAAGSHSVVAVYNGDANYGSSTAAALVVAIAKAGTSTTLTAGAGGALTATVTVSAPGAGSPTGSVQFLQSAGAIGTAPLVQQGSGYTATLTVSGLSGNVWAAYQGDSNFSSSSSPVAASLTQVQVSISSDQNPASSGHAITFTVKVSAASGTGVPSGTVQLSADGASLGTATLASGQAPFLATLAVGTHTIAASYSGDSSFAAATASIQQVVSKPAVSLTLSPSLAMTVYGQAVTLTALLSPQGSGTVQFWDSAAALGSGQLSNGSASLAVSNLAAGTHSLTATWVGDANSAAVVSAPLAQVVNRAQTAVSLTLVGAVLTASVSVITPGSGAPTGVVQFLNSNTSAVLASVAVINSTASTPAPATIDSMVAAYSGDGNFLPATSTPLGSLTAMNAASYAATSFAPDELATLFGTNLATSTLSAAAGPLPALGGTTVSLSDSAGVKHVAPLLFVSPGQASFLVPSDTAPGAATVVVTNANGTTSSTAIQMAVVAPGLFTLNATGQGVPAAQYLRVHADGSQDAVQDVGVFDKAGNQWVPATIDMGLPTDSVYLMLYGTGIRHHGATPVCTIAGQAAAVVFAGAQGSYAGLDQVNVAVPQSLRGGGGVELRLLVDGVAANVVTLAFK